MKISFVSSNDLAIQSYQLLANRSHEHLLNITRCDCSEWSLKMLWNEKFVSIAT